MMMPEKRRREFSSLEKVSMQVAAGGSAGFIEVSIMQPLDVAKTRLQLQNRLAATSEVS